MSEQHEQYEDISESGESILPAWLANTRPEHWATFAGSPEQQRKARVIRDTPDTEKLHIPYDQAVAWIWE